VTEETTAWHAGNFEFNQRSIGIEHVGFATKPFAEAEYVASAKLVDHLTTKYGIPRDRAHIIGHDQIPNGNKIAQDSAPCGLSPKQCQSSPNYGGASKHTDPGIWEWATFMARFDGIAKCNDVGDLWTCSHDKSKAFRCAADKVELETCNGTGACEAMADGKDDVCHVAPKTETPDPVAPDPPATRPATGFLEPTAPAPAQEDSGCAVGPARSNPNGWAAAAMLGAMLFLGARRQRRS
jgi:MYXO-CTERM domain-containing protein